jgi:hypothetical protein
LRAWFFWLIFGALGLLYFLPEIKAAAADYPALLGVLSLLEKPRTAAVIIAAIGCAFLAQPVWRMAWRLPRLGNYLSEKIFPDLNGKWDIEIRSNWPIINALQSAARSLDAARVDVQGNPAALPPLSTFRFEGQIKQTWYRASLTIFPSGHTPLRTSRTLCFELIPETEDRPKQVGWVFRQENREVAATDEDNFLGSALLEVIGSDKLVGKYWNNRSWRKGLNAAGEIQMTRQPM